MGLPSITSVNAIPSAVDLPKSVAFGKQSRQAFAVASHCLRTDGVKRYQHVVGSRPEAAGPVLWRTRPVSPTKAARSAAPAMKEWNDSKESVGLDL